MVAIRRAITAALAIVFFVLPLFVQASSASVAGVIKACIAKEIAGINAHDPIKATACEADDTISMESGRPASVGRDNYIAGLKMGFQYEPTWHLRLIEETVEVPKSEDLAVYRSTYWQDSAIAGAPATQKVNYIALFRKYKNGSWKIAWSIVSNIEKPHKIDQVAK